ncbi:MAG TPA: glycosyltransferase family 39 protein [Gaiellaceae bacterium]
MAVGARQRTVAAAAVRVPTWAWVGGLVVVSTVAYALLGRRIAAPWILIDELVYSEGAKSFADTGHFLVRDRTWEHFGPIYPAVVSPAWALFSSAPQAYAAAKLINALLISLAAVPAYFLGRRVLSPRFALVGAALSVALPSMLYSGTIMTENAFYPVFLAAALLLVLVLERPTVLRSVALLAVCTLAFFTRAQAVALIPPILTAPLLLVLFRRSGLRSLKAYLPLYGVTALVLLPPILVELARGRSPTDLFGRYSFVGNERYPVGSVAKWFVYHIAELDLYLGIVPFAALLLLVALVRRLPDRSQVFTAAAVTLAVWLLLVVAAVDQTYTFVHRVAERNMFYAAPLFVIALLIWVERGLPRPRRWAAGAAIAAAALPAVLPLGWMLNISIVSDTLALIPWWRLDLELGSAGWTRALLVLCCVAAGALFLFLPRRFRLVLPGLVLAYFIVVMAFVEHDFRRASTGTLGAVGSAVPNWIDHAVPSGASVAIVYTGKAAPVTIWENEFFNRSAGPVYDLGEPTPGALPETRVAIDPRTGSLRGAEPANYALSDVTAPLDGTAIGTAGQLTLYRVPGKVGLKTLVEGLYPGETWSGPHVRYTRFDCTGGRVAVLLGSDPKLFISRKMVTATELGRVVARVSVPPAHPVRLVLPLRPRAGVCRVDFAVSPAPLLTIPRGTPARPIGARFQFQ